MSFASIGPYPNLDTFLYGAQFWKVADLFRLAQVCKIWNQWMENSTTWESIFKLEGIPLVEEKKGKKRNYRADFKVLYPITISRRMIERCLGQFIGTIPRLDEERFNELSQPDPFEKGKTKGQTFRFLVEPQFIKRKFGNELSAMLDEKGNLTITPRSPEGSSATEQELLIPFSLPNLKTLASYPLTMPKNGPIFDKNSDMEVFDQCNSCSEKVSIYFMRFESAAKKRCMSYEDIKQIVESSGFQVMSLRPRAFANVVSILTSGTCPDDKNGVWAYVRTSDPVRKGNHVFQACVGGFFKTEGLNVSCRYNYEVLGVVPYLPAESSTMEIVR